MKRTLLYAFGGLLLGGIIHIVVVMLVPTYSNRDAWTSIGRFGDDNHFHSLPMAEPGTEALPFLDPSMAYAACRFSLAEGPIRFRAALQDGFWSLGVFDRRGRNIYSLNDRSAENASLDLILATSPQLADLRQAAPPSLDSAIVIESPIDSGFAVLRVFVPDETLLPQAQAGLKAAVCADRP